MSAEMTGHPRTFADPFSVSCPLHGGPQPCGIVWCPNSSVVSVVFRVPGVDTLTDALQEARAALLNPNLSDGERAQVVRVVEGALVLAKAAPGETAP